jgi:uncharacterized protein
MKNFTLTCLIITSFCSFPLSAQVPGKKTESIVKVKAKADKPATDGTQTVTVTLTIEKGWHVYANPPGNDDLKSSQTIITVNGADKPTTTKTTYPKSKKIKDALVGDYEIYEGTAEVKVTIKRALGSNGLLEASVKCQACNDKSCLPAATIKVKVD